MFRYFLFLIHAPGKRRLLAAMTAMILLALGMGFLLNAIAQPVGEPRRLPLGISFSLAFVMTLLLPISWYWHLARFGMAIRGFRSLPGKGVLLRYAPQLAGKSELPLVLQQCEQAISEFNENFGFPLKRKLLVFLLSTPAQVGRLFKMRAGAVALIGGDAIMLSAEGSATRTQECICHELAHLFSHYWGRLDPPLKGEGLATWLQGSWEEKPLDMEALAFMLTDRFGYLSWILDSRVFYDTHWLGYVLAGSFTGFLIAKFGWDSYRGFFQRSSAMNFQATFQKTFGISLVTAERQWREELLSRRQSFEPELSEVVRRRNVASAFNAWQFYRCLDLAEELFRSRQADMTVVGIAAGAHAFLGHYGNAVELMKQVVQSDDPAFRANPSAAWLCLGELHDLLGQRQEAIAAYQQCLAAADGFFPVQLSTHRVARRHLKKPFTEKDWLKRIKPKPQRK